MTVGVRHRGGRSSTLPLLLVLATGCSSGPSAPLVPGVTASVAVSPAAAFLRPGAVLSLSATPYDRDSVVVQERTATWSSANAGVAQVSSAGVITATGTGSTIITATIDGVRARMAVSVATAPTAVPAWELANRAQTDVTFLGIWMATPDEGWAVGQRGGILHTDDGGVTWESQPTPTNVSLTSVWGTDRTNVYAVGSAGMVLRYNGQSWSRVTVPSGNTFLRVWGFGPDAIWVVGVDVAMRWDGTSWRETILPGPAELWGVWGSSPANMQAVGQNGLILRWDGNSWQTVASPYPELLLSIWGSSATNAWAVGVQGTILHWDGAAWRIVPSPTRGSLFSVWGRNTSEVWAVGNNGVMLRWNGLAWSLVPQRATGENLRAVHGAGATGIAVAGWNGTILRRAASGWTAAISSPVLYDIVEDLAVGSGGVVYRRSADGATLMREETPTHLDLYAVARLGTDYLAVGDSGLILRRIAGTWYRVPSGTQAILRSIWVPPGGGPATIVGDRGEILRQDGAGWVPENSGANTFLRWVSGLGAGDRIAVGDEGLILRDRGGGWKAMRSGTGARLRTVWASGPTNILAAGDGGIVLRFDGVRWYPMEVPIRVEWRALWGSGPRDTYLAGAGGVILHFDGAKWTRLSTPTNQLLLSLRPGTTPGSFQVVGVTTVVLDGKR